MQLHCLNLIEVKYSHSHKCNDTNNNNNIILIIISFGVFSFGQNFNFDASLV